jgi:hypothetical protein
MRWAGMYGVDHTLQRAVQLLSVCERRAIGSLLLTLGHVAMLLLSATMAQALVSEHNVFEAAMASCCSCLRSCNSEHPTETQACETHAMPDC